MENFSDQLIRYLIIAFWPPFGPFIIGLIVFIIDVDWIDKFTEKIEQYVRGAAASIDSTSNWLQRNLTRPILNGFVWLSNWTDSFTSRGLKNGVRVCFAYWALFIIIYVWVVAIFLIVSFFVLKVMAAANGRPRRYEDDY